MIVPSLADSLAFVNSSRRLGSFNLINISSKVSRQKCNIRKMRIAYD